MTARRLFLLALLAALAAPISAQALVLKGGPAILAEQIGPTAGGSDLQANVQAGARVWLTDLFQVQGTLGYSDRLAAEAIVQVRPYGPDRKVEPYGFFGYGYLFGGEGRETVFPVGLGAEYRTDQSIGLFFEIAGRWQSALEPRTEENRLDFYFAPSVGVSYDFNSPRPAPRLATNRSDWQPPAPSASTDMAVAGEDEVQASSRTPRTRTPRDRSQVEAARRAFEEAAPLEPQAVLQAEWDWWAQPSDDVTLLDGKVRIPDGTFIMGLTDEDPLLLQTAGLKRVTISGFVLDQHEVTNADYRAYVDANAESAREALTPDPTAWQRAGSAMSMQDYFLSGSYDDYPVVALTWQQANDFCAYAGGRLPTEAEWEYAARSGLPGGIYPWPGLEPRNPEGAYLANYNPGRGLYAADGYAFTAPVESFQPTPWGLYNMSGNAAEWVQDSYSASYSALSNFNPTYVDPEEPRRIVRGGSWASDDFYIGVGVRDAQRATEAAIFTGFRCAYGIGTMADEPAMDETPAETMPDPDGN